MLSRRHLRIKVFQALYSYFQAEEPNMNKYEKDLFTSIHKFYDSYLLTLLLLIEFNESARLTAIDAKQRYFPSEDITDTSTKFIDNLVLQKLAANTQLELLSKQRKISWQKDIEVVRKWLAQLRKTDEFRNYISGKSDYAADLEFVSFIVKKFLAANESFNHLMEEKNLFWVDDKSLLIPMVIKTLKLFTEEAEGEKVDLLRPLHDKEDDEAFIQELFRKTIVHDEELSKSIADKTKNWELERIALTDVILMKMALTEILQFSFIPIKVSINEYIEISKDYSTPKSKTFINGVVDKIVDDLKAEGKIRKTGKGLIN